MHINRYPSRHNPTQIERPTPAYSNYSNTRSHSNLFPQDNAQTHRLSSHIKQHSRQPSRLGSQYERIPALANPLNNPPYTHSTQPIDNYQYSSLMRNQSSPNIAKTFVCNLYPKQAPVQNICKELTSKDYLVHTYEKIEPKMGGDSMSTTAAGEFYRSQKMPSMGPFNKSDADMEFKASFGENKMNTIESQRIQKNIPSTEYTKFRTHQDTPHVPGTLLDDILSSLKGVSAFQLSHHVNTPKQIARQITDSKTPVPQRVRIEQPPKKQQRITPLNHMKVFQRRNAHERQSIKGRDLSLPYNPEVVHTTNPIEQERQKSPTKTDVNNYIGSINQKNKKIAQLQSKIVSLENIIQEKDEIIQKHVSEIKFQKSNHKQMLEAANKQMSRLKKQVELNEYRRFNNNAELEDKFRKINLDNEQIGFANNILQREVESLKKELTKKKESEGIQEGMYGKLKGMLIQKTNRIAELEKMVDRMREENNRLRFKASEVRDQEARGRQVLFPENDKNEMFNEILKMNEQENTKYKNNIAAKDEEIHRLEDLNRELRATNETLKNQIEIQKLKRMTDLKNLQTNFQIEEQVRVNEVSSLNKLLKSMEEKLKLVINEDKKKDQFMVTYLKNRAQAPEEKAKIEQFFKKFQLLSVNTNIVQCLKREAQQIETLKAQLRRIVRK